MPSAASTMYCRVRARDRVHQQRCAIGTSDRNAASASPPASSRSAIVTNVLAAPFSDHTAPLIICRNHAARAASTGPTSSDSASLSSRLTTSTLPRSYTSSAALTSRSPFRRGSAVSMAARSSAPAATMTAPRRRAIWACSSNAEATSSSCPTAAAARCHSRRSGSRTTSARAAYIASRCAGGAVLATADRISGC